MNFPKFQSDYMEGAHVSILERLIETNLEKTVGYGEDEYSKSAKEKIKAACNAPNARVHFLVGGTQTNATVIDSILAPYQGVVSALTGHIACHESGAIEASGHKIITIPSHDGKISAKELEAVFVGYMNDESREHTVMPGAVYVSHPTEYGTLYTKAELAEIHSICKKYDAPLFLDGARLGYGLVANGTDLSLSDIAEYTDVFYIGGTKVGALFGEAVVITNEKLCPCFLTMIKRHGAMLAKGRLLGIQFDTLFTDGLYLKIARNAIDMAEYLKAELLKRGYSFHIDSPTNQLFVIMSDEKIKVLRENVGCTYWERIDDKSSVIRFVTSFATTKEQVDELLKFL